MNSPKFQHLRTLSKHKSIRAHGFVLFVFLVVSKGSPVFRSWGTPRIPTKDWGTLGKIRGITTPPFESYSFYTFFRFFGDAFQG